MICFAQNETNGSVDFNDKNMAITSCWLAFVVTKTKHTRGHPTQLVVVELITIILAFSQIRVLQRMLGLNLAIPILLVRDCSSEQITLRPHWACLVPWQMNGAYRNPLQIQVWLASMSIWQLNGLTAIILLHASIAHITLPGIYSVGTIIASSNGYTNIPKDAWPQALVSAWDPESPINTYRTL